MMRIAHVSDLHVLALDGVPLSELLRGKRLQGYANLTLKRRYQHDVRVASRVLREVREQRPDLVVITGDLSNLALEQEFRAARTLIESELRLGAERLMIVPGNHDAYTRQAWIRRAFEHTFADWLVSDEAFRSRDSDDPYPVVRIRGDVALVGLTSAVPRGALVASGEIGGEQLQRFARVLEHDEIRRRALLVLVHHPITGMHGPVHVWMRGLRDARALVECLRDRAGTLIVHGHLHRPVFHRVAVHSGELLVSGVTSASLAQGYARHAAGYQLITREAGSWRVQAMSYDRQRDSFDAVELRSS